MPSIIKVFGGETTYGGLERIAAVLLIRSITAASPNGCLYPTDIPDPTDDLVLIMEGTNDHNMQYPFEDIDANLREMVAIAHLHGKKVIIATNPPALDETGRSYYGLQTLDSANRRRFSNPGG